MTLFKRMDINGNFNRKKKLKEKFIIKSAIYKKEKIKKEIKVLPF